MKSSHILIASLWLISIAAAYLIGGKPTLSNDSVVSADGSTSAENSRPAYRRPPPSSNTTPRRNTSGNRSNNVDSTAVRELDIASIVKNTDPIARVNNLLRLINRLGSKDFAHIVADFRELGITRERMSEYSMLLHAWGKADPLGALDYAGKNTRSTFARQTILASWAGSDVESALQWAKDNHEGDDANPWLVGVIRGIASHAPTRATAILQTLPYSRERGDALAAIIPHIARQGIDHANDWLATIDDERLRSGGTAYLASALAKTDPSSTADWIATLPESDGKTRATRQIAEQWFRQDLNAAVAWTDSLNGAPKTVATLSIISSYAQENATQASNWLRSMSSEPHYEKLVETYIWQTARNNPDLSLAHVPEIDNPKTQDRFYERILRNWHRRDAASAEAWMNSHDLSDRFRNRIVRSKENIHRNP